MSKDTGKKLEGSHLGVPDNGIHRASLWVEQFKTEVASPADVEFADAFLEAISQNTLDYDGEDLLRASMFYGQSMLVGVGKVADLKALVASIWLDGWLHGAAAMKEKEAE